MTYITLKDVHGAFVAELKMPEFHELPRVVLWQNRAFVIGVPTQPIYFEAFTWNAPEGSDVGK